jgi:predicted metalloprotease
MRWRGERQSSNVEDRRGAPRGVAVGGLGVLIVVIVAALFGADPRALLQQMQQTGLTTETGQTQAPASPEEEELKQFVSVVLASTEDVWQQQFQQGGAAYEQPTLVLFSQSVESACGMAGSAVGPFYCPGDRKVYLDLEFFRVLKERLGAPGDFAQAYVIAHEVGHHVQNLLGVSDQVHQMRGRVSEKEYNQLSVQLELQADFYAGVWAHHAQEARQLLEQGDIEEALNAASMIGDDHLQRQSQGTVVPDAFTHGTSEQRVRWFKKGLESGDVRQGDTFNAPRL